LDQASSYRITHVTLREIGDEKTYMISVSTDETTSIFYTRSVGSSANGKASSVTKSKVVKKECTIKSAVNEQIISASLQNETNVSVVHGSVFSMKRSQIKLIDDSGKVQKDISLSAGGSIATDEKESSKKSVQKKDNDQYQVMGIEDEGNSRVNNLMNGGNMRQLVPQTLQLSLLNDDDDIESRLTSVSSKNFKITKSLGTVLSQALTADDAETLDWVLSNRDESIVQNTLLNLKDHKLISALFKQIVIKFQAQDLGKQQGVLLWLKTLISLHWLTIIKRADKDDLANLGQIQSFI
jgi:hypothetical protein